MTISILEQQDPKSLSCGIDHSCPTSVTTPTGQGVRLDQYQSSIRGKTKTGKRQRRTTIIPDHKFEWYDLDAIREVDSDTTNSNDDSAIIIRHDFHAGLLFTTDRQVLRKGMEVNVSNHSSVGIKDHKSRQDVEKDLRFWCNKVRETPDERGFRERMEELEQEVSRSDLVFSSSLSLSLSSFSYSEAKNEHDRDGSNRSFMSIDRDGSNRSYISSWLFDDEKVQ